MENKKLLLIGGGGHAKALMDILSLQGCKLEAIIAPSINIRPELLNGVECFRNDDVILSYHPKDVMIINGLGLMPGSSLRSQIFSKFRMLKYSFLSVIADSANISSHCKLGMGVQVMPGAIINTDASIGQNSIVNTGAIIEHDCRIGTNNHIAPGATICGDVLTHDNVFVGAGATVIQKVSIGKNSVVAAGSSVASDLGQNLTHNPF